MLRSVFRPSSGLGASMCRATASASSHASVVLALPTAQAAPASCMFLLASRGVVVDRATKLVSLKGRSRRQLLRKIARTESGPNTAARRLASDPAPLASFEASAGNLHQFIAFLARQSQTKAIAPPADVTGSTNIVRSAAAPAWELSFERLEHLMRVPSNTTFRACEELLGALSDPTTDLGQRGLTPAQLETVLGYVRRTIKATFALTTPRLEDASGEFQLLSAEDQYLLAGAHSVAFLVARISNRPTEEAAALLSARSQGVLPPSRTLLAEAMQYDVYPPTDPASLAKSAQWPVPPQPEALPAPQQQSKKAAKQPKA